jgi:hypothetical protein
MPKNWYRVTLCTDLTSPLELIPGNNIAFLSLERALATVLNRERNVISRITSLVYLIIMYSPSILFRACVKSTFFVYVPLLYVVSESNRGDRQNPAVLKDRVIGHPASWGALILAILTLALAALSHLDIKMISQFSRLLLHNLVSPVEFVAFIDWNRVRWWQWISILSAVLTLFIFERSFHLRIDLKHQYDNNIAILARSRAEFIYYLIRIRNTGAILVVLAGALHFFAFSPHSFGDDSDILRDIRGLFE